MATIGLAMDIADVVLKAANQPEEPLDIEAAAAALAEAHPEVEATKAEIAEIVREEGIASGAVPPKPAEL